jgi:hypothetical protein
MGSVAMIFIPSFINNASEIQKVGRGRELTDKERQREIGDLTNLLLFLQNNEIRLK